MNKTYYLIRLCVEGELKYLLSKRFTVYFYGYAKRFRSKAEAERYFKLSEFSTKWHEVIKF